MENFRKHKDNFLERHRLSKRVKTTSKKPFRDAMNLLTAKINKASESKEIIERCSIVPLNVDKKELNEEGKKEVNQNLSPATFQSTNSIKSIMESPLGRFHLAKYIEREKPHLLNLIYFRTKYANLQIDLENKRIQDVESLSSQLQKDFLTPNGIYSILSIIAISKKDWDLLKNFTSVDDMVVNKLQQQVYYDFIRSEEGSQLFQRLLSLRDHHVLRRINMAPSELQSVDMPKGIYIEGNEIRGILEIKEKKTSLRNRNKWKRRHVHTKGNVLIIYAESSNLLDIQRNIKIKLISLLHANVVECTDNLNHFDLRLDVQAWSKGNQGLSEPRSFFLKAESQLHYKVWSDFLTKRTHECTRIFQEKNNSMGKRILSYFDLRKEIGKSLTITTRDFREKKNSDIHVTGGIFTENNTKDKKQQFFKTPVGALRQAFATSIKSTQTFRTKSMFYSRVFLFSSIIHLVASFHFSIAWIFALAGLWTYTDHLLHHKIIMDSYPSFVFYLSLIYIGTFFFNSSLWIFFLIPFSYIIGHKELTNQYWAIKRWVEGKKIQGYPKACMDDKADLKQLEWLNLVLTSAWPNLKRTTEDSIKAAGKQLLADNRPSFLASIDILNLSFGNPPSIVGVFVRNDCDKEIGSNVSIDIDIEWFDEPEIILRVSTKAGVSTQVELTELEFSGSIRLEFILDGWEDDIPLWPCFSALSYAFTKKPQMNFRIKTMKVDVMNLPLLSDWLHSLIYSLIAANFTYPNCITLPDWRTKKTNNLHSTEQLVPLGILAIKVIQVKRVVKFDKFNNVFCQVALDGEYRKQQVFRTRKISDNTSMPEWNETFYFLIDDPIAQSLTIKLISSKTIGRDASLLETTHSIYSMLDNPTQSLQLPLDDKSQGTLIVDLTWKKVNKQCSINTQNSSTTLITSSKQNSTNKLNSTYLSTPSLFPSLPSFPGILIITLISGEGINSNNKDSINPKGFLYIAFSLGGQDGFNRSENAKDCQEPEWNQTFYFIVHNSNEEKRVLHIQLLKSISSSSSKTQFNILTDEIVGQNTLDINQIALETKSEHPFRLALETSFQVTNGSTPVTSGQQLAGYLKMKIQWRILE